MPHEPAAVSQERNLQTPLLIGGATTSKMHTAVKIEPQYKGAIFVSCPVPQQIEPVCRHATISFFSASCARLSEMDPTQINITWEDLIPHVLVIAMDDLVSTAVACAGPVVHVLDASRSVPVAQTLLDKKTQVQHFPPNLQTGRTGLRCLKISRLLAACQCCRLGYVMWLLPGPEPDHVWT